MKSISHLGVCMWICSLLATLTLGGCDFSDVAFANKTEQPVQMTLVTPSDGRTAIVKMEAHQTVMLMNRGEDQHFPGIIVSFGDGHSVKYASEEMHNLLLTAHLENARRVTWVAVDPGLIPLGSN